MLPLKFILIPLKYQRHFKSVENLRSQKNLVSSTSSSGTASDFSSEGVLFYCHKAMLAEVLRHSTYSSQNVLFHYPTSHIDEGKQADGIIISECDSIP
jgi:hypothetical protein